MPFGNRHAVLIALDGTRPDALEKALSQLSASGQAPRFCTIFAEGLFDTDTFSGGEFTSKDWMVSHCNCFQERREQRRSRSL